MHSSADTAHGRSTVLSSLIVIVTGMGEKIVQQSVTPSVLLFLYNMSNDVDTEILIGEVERRMLLWDVPMKSTKTENRV